VEKARLSIPTAIAQVERKHLNRLFGRLRNCATRTDEKDPTKRQYLKDYWFSGWEVQRKITTMLTLGAELVNQANTTEDGETQTGFTIGASVDLTDYHHLLFSIG
jgi:hypothetical protein